MLYASFGILVVLIVKKICKLRLGWYLKMFVGCPFTVDEVKVAIKVEVLKGCRPG